MKLYIINWQSGEPLIAAEVEYPEQTAKNIIEAWKDNPQPMYATAKWVQGNVDEVEEPQPPKPQISQEPVEEKKEEEKPKKRRRKRTPRKPKSVEDIENQKTVDE